MRTQDEIRAAFVARAVARAKANRRRRWMRLVVVAALGLILGAEIAAAATCRPVWNPATRRYVVVCR